MNDKVIETKGLTKRFGSFTAVDHISFEVGRGEIFGFLGANGAGKTTRNADAVRSEPPTEGGGTVAGFDIVRQSEQIKRNIGYMSQRFSAVRRPESVGKHPAVRRHLRHGKPADRRKDPTGCCASSDSPKNATRW